MNNFNNVLKGFSPPAETATEIPETSQQREVLTVQPVALSELVKMWGTAKVGEETGYAQATIATAMRENQCRYTLELLAKFLLEQHTKEAAPRFHTVITRVRSDKLQALMSVCNALDVAYTVFED